MLIGHQRIWDFLTRSVQQNRLAHAYLFVGPAQVGKLTLAREWAKWQLCEQNNPTPEKGRGPLGALRPTLSSKRRGGDFQSCGQCRQCLAIEHGQNSDLIILSPRVEEKDGVVKTAEIFGWDIRKQIAARKLAIIAVELYDFDKLKNTIEDAVARLGAKRLVIDPGVIFRLYFETYCKSA